MQTLLPRTTEHPVRKRGDEPRSNCARSATDRLLMTELEQGECSGLPVTLWSNLSVETTHLSRGSCSTGQSHGRKLVVRGLLMVDNTLFIPQNEQKPLGDYDDAR